MSRYKAYPEYRDSGLLGLDKIPTCWNIQRVKFLFDIGRGRVISQEELVDDGLYPVYSSQTMNNGCLGYIGSYDFDCDQITWTTDGANAGTVFLRSGKHNCTNVCGTLQPKNKSENLKFYLYCLEYVTQFYKRPDTNGAKIMNGEMAEIFVSQPSDCEKEIVTAFLDHETAKIDVLIEKQQRLIELLKEKRQAVISHAVTRGLNPNAPMKDSGVEWLGQVPAHWKVSRLGYFALKIGSGKTPRGGSEIYQDQGVLFLRSQNIYDEGLRVDEADCVYISEEINSEMASTQVRPGDVLLNITGGSIGRSCIVPDDFLLANVNQHVCILRFPSCLNLFFSLFIRAQAIQAQIDSCQTGGNREGLNFEQISKMTICLPPESERKIIVEYINAAIEKFNTLEFAALQTVGLLQERRTALISAAVTGKIDVRDWQAPA